MESKFSKLQVDVLKAALQGEGKAVKSPVNAEFKAALSVELESIARAQASVEDSGVSVGLERLSNGKNMPPIASGFISQKPSYSLDTVLPDISTREFDVYALGPKVPESRFVLRSQELAAPSLYLSEIVSNKKGSNAVLHDANGGRGRLEDKDLSLISRLGVLPGQKQLESVRKEVVSVHSQATEIFMPVDSDSSSGRKLEQARYADDAVRGAGSVANRVSPEAQTPPSVTQQSLASADDAVRGAGSVANRVSPEAQTPPSVTQQSLASADDAVRGAGSVANRVSPEAQTPPSVTQQSLASADDAVRGAGSVANRVSPEAQTPPSVTQQSLVAAQESVSRFEPGVSRNVASSAAAEFSMSNRLVRSDEAKNKATGKDIDQSVDAKLVRSDAELSRREAHKQTSGEFVNRAEPPQINMIRGVELKDTHFPQRSGERLMDYLPVAENVSSSKAADGKAISGEFVQYLETRVSNGISVDRSNFDSKVMVSNPTDRTSISAGGGGAALAAAVGKQLIDRISAGTERVRLVLHPKELGVVDVTMDVKNGKVDAILASANPVTREMLGDNLGRLRESLMQAGFDSGDVEVSDRPASDGSSDRNGDVPTAMQVADNDGAINSGVEVTEIEIVLDPDEIDFLV
jgi:flagellar hook-length control protein FliK